MIAPLGKNFRVIGGAIAKNRCIYNYYCQRAKVILIDTYWERKNWFQYLYYKFIRKVYILLKIMISLGRIDAVIIGSNDDNNIRILKMFRLLEKSSLFAIGGLVPDRVKASRYGVEVWSRLRRIYVESEEMESALQDMGITNTRFLRNFKFLPTYDSVYFHNERGILKLLYHGRICPDKGMDCLMDAMRIINRGQERAILSLYGAYEAGWEIPEDVKSYAFYKGKPDLIDSLDHYDELYQYDIYIFPSRWRAEGLSGSLQDALAVGKPIIASKHNMNDKIVKDGYNGLLFETDNSEELAKCIMKLYENRKLIETMGKNSLKEADKYRVEIVLSEVDLYGD